MSHAIFEEEISGYVDTNAAFASSQFVVVSVRLSQILMHDQPLFIICYGAYLVL